MSEKSLIRTWNGEPATFVDAHDGKVAVTVGEERKEMSEADWEALSSHNPDDHPKEFNKAKPTG